MASLGAVLAAVLAVLAQAAAPASGPAASAPARPAYQNAYVFTLAGEISDLTLRTLETHFAAAQAAGADLVVLKIDTWGGLLTSAIESSQFIKRQPVHTVAWVDPKAISAGAMIAIACDEMVIAPSAVLGDCAPISSDGSLQGVEREKAESPTRAEFRDSARKNGYNVALAMAMVTASDGFYLVERRDDPARRKIVPTAEMEQLTAGPEATSRPAVPVAAEEVGQWKVVRQVLAAGQLLTMHDDEAVEFGFARAVVANETQLRAALNIAGPIKAVAPSWSESLAIWLGGSTVRGLLMGLLVLSLWIAFQAPGHGLPEVAAVVLLVLVMVPPYLTGLANWLEIALIIVGLLLLAVEIFLLPGFGLPGIAGAVMLLAGLVLTFVQTEPGSSPFSWPTLPYTWQQVNRGLTAVTFSSLGGFVAGLIAMRFIPHTRWGRRVIPANPLPDGRLPPLDPSVTLPPLPVEAHVGDLGRCETDLRPAGKARVGDRLLDVVAVGQFLPRGAVVRVVRVEPNRIVVEPRE